tara:strand:+ start:314 stop:622 length:309 start_codon:yes stop_codon:yes gene_type:complete
MTRYNKLLILDDQGPDENLQVEMRVQFDFWPGTSGSNQETPEHDAGEPDELELLAVKVLSADSGIVEFNRSESPKMFEAMDRYYMSELTESEILRNLAENES